MALPDEFYCPRCGWVHEPDDEEACLGPPSAEWSDDERVVELEDDAYPAQAA